MRCYYHQDRDAVGFCKSCNKGLCPHCLVDLGKGLACKGRCEADVRELIIVTEVNVAISAKVPRQLRANRLTYSLMGWFLTGFGALFMLFGFWNHPAMEVLLLIGGFFVFFGLLSLIIVARMPRFDATETSAQSQGSSPGDESA